MVYFADVLIIGKGIAGIASAIECAKKNLKVIIVSRSDEQSHSNTYWAQGGIIYGPSTQGEMEQLATDIQNASAHTSNPAAVSLFVEKGRKIFEDILLHFAHTDFETTSTGDLILTQEAAHSEKRIAYKGDHTGRVIQKSLEDTLKLSHYQEYITELSHHTAIDLITPNFHGVNHIQRYEEHQIVGAYVFDNVNQKVLKVMAKYTVLATGGVGAIYLHHSNDEGARGDGLAMARRVGAQLVDMEYIQFHPTTYYDSSEHRRFLISEAVRGEGGILLNGKGEAFMENAHPLKDLAPRDVVSRAILEQMIQGPSDCVYLDISFKSRDYLQERFPTIYHHLKSKHLDMAETPIPVVPAAHYTCGGIKVDLFGQTSIKNLFAVGEVSCSGLHGANRLASTSLLEGLISGTQAAQKIAHYNHHSKSEIYPHEHLRDWVIPTKKCDLALVKQDWMTLKQTMWNYVGIKRSGERLTRAKAMLLELKEEVQSFYRGSELSDPLIGLTNAIEVGIEITKASWRNKQSVGCFYRSDA